MSASSAPPCAKISLAIADFESLLSQEFVRAIAGEPALEILEYAGSPSVLKQILANERPAILLVKSASTKNTLATLTMAHRVSPSTRSIVISTDLSRDEVVALFHAQARGILSAEANAALQLCKCISSVHAGQIWASNAYLGFLVESLPRANALQAPKAPLHPTLSVREVEVVQLLALGLSNRNLAIALGLSEHTIKNHLFHIFGKLGVSSRAEALLFAVGQRERQRA